MENEIFCEIVRPPNWERDVESPPRVYVTRESNGFAVFQYHDQSGLELVEFFFRETDSKVKALRSGIELVDQLRADPSF